MDVLKVKVGNVRDFVGGYMSTEPSPQTGTRGTAYSWQDFVITQDTLTISVYKNIGMFVDEADRHQQSYAGQMSIADIQGEKISEYVESQMLAQHGSWQDFGQTDLDNGAQDDTTAITVSASNIDDIIRAVKRKLYTHNLVNRAVKNGVFFVWRPEDFEMLEAYVQAWNKILGLVKSLLNTGKVLQRITRGKLEQFIALLQPQRLSGETMQFA